MQKIPKQEDPAAFKEPAITPVTDGQTVGAVANERGLVGQTLRNGVKAFDAGTLNGAGTAQVTAEAMALARLPAENARLQREVEILKQATAYCARAAR